MEADRIRFAVVARSTAGDQTLLHGDGTARRRAAKACATSDNHRSAQDVDEQAPGASSVERPTDEDLQERGQEIRESKNAALLGEDEKGNLV